MTAFRLELRRNRSMLIGLGLSLGAYAVIMGLMYPVLRDNDELMRSYMDTFPKEFLAAFGMTGVLSDPGVFYTTYIASWLWPIMAAAAALLAGTRPVAVDLDRGFLDLPLATPVSRIRYLASAIWGQLVLMAVLALVASMGLWATGVVMGGAFDVVGFALAGLLSFAFGCAVAGTATLVAVLTLSRGMTSAIVGGVLFAMYAIFVVTQISADWAWIAPISAWNHFPTTRVIDERYVPLGDLALFGVIAACSWIGALVAFRRRDLAS